MNKKSVLAASVMALLFILPLKGDWKKDIKEYFQKVHEYENIAQYIETHLEDIPDNEKSQAIIILCYAYREIGDIVNEEKWVAEFFKNYLVDDPDFLFLSRKEQVEIYEYLQQWKRRYPGIKKININKQSYQIRYFTPPEKFYINIHAIAPCEIKIINIDNQYEILYSGYLTQGPNTIGFPFTHQLKRQNETLLEIVLKSGSIERNKSMVLAAAYQYPQTIKFEPQEGKIAIIGKDFKQETSEEMSQKTRRYFDKKHFMKKAVPHLAVGLGIYLLDYLLIKNNINRESRAPGTRALMNGIDKTATVFAIGISLKGLIHVFRSFKKEKKGIVKTITFPDAVQHNNELRKKIQKAKEHIFVTYRLNEVKREAKR